MAEEMIQEEGLKEEASGEEALKGDILKIEGDAKGVWISALTDELTLPMVVNFLRAKGVRKYDGKAVENFVQQKNRSPQKIADRNESEEKNALVVVQLAKDSMSASVSVEAPFFTKPWPDEKDVKDALTRKNVVFGIDEDAIRKLVELKLIDEPVTVAQGKAAQNGKNAWIELLLDPDKIPEIDQEAQKIDHRTRSVFLNVLRGQEIGVKHPMTGGEDGKSVVGSAIKAVPGKDTVFPIKSGLEVVNDGLSLVASIDGCLLRKEGKLSILPELEVKGDVDFGVGNINFTGSVKIQGAVREGFQVIATGDIYIKEMVEGALVESAGNILIQGGVRGMGRGRIIAEGNVTVGFVDQAYISSRADIKIKDAVFHSDIVAQNSVTVMGGQKAQIAGGKVQAGLEVVCQTLGSEMGTKTEVIVGVPPAQAERRKELLVLVAQHKDNLAKLEANLGFLKKQDLAGALDENKRAILVTATKTKFQLQSALSSAENELKGIEERLELSKAKGVVRIKDVCYPGVSIVIRGAVYVVREPFKYAAFICEDGEVRLQSYDCKI